MRTIRRLIEAKKVEREENGEAGFSLIELIIVVVILGILVAVAIPLFGNIQNEARLNATKTAAANAAVQWTSGLASTPAEVKAYSTSDGKITVSGQPADTSVLIEDVCASAVHADITTGPGSAADPITSGPGC